MFREMRRKRQVLSKEEISSVLYRGTSGVLALAGDDNYPYAVPISYVYMGRKSIFTVPKAATNWMRYNKTKKFLSVLSTRIKLFLMNTPAISEV